MTALRRSSGQFTGAESGRVLGSVELTGDRHDMNEVSLGTERSEVKIVNTNTEIEWQG
ncbi:hypothetical protein [Micromonospora siamensis]|nr:hypothetical protein [Micromonospora siamensis]